MARRFVVLDVFTDRTLSGNPLAVVLDTEGLDGNHMQAITREFNLSETVFVVKPQEAENRARLRIFTPNHELPFAGHPTVGAAVLLALRDGVTTSADFVLEENVGPVACHVAVRGEHSGSATFTVPRVPEIVDAAPMSREDCAQALGLDTSDIGFDGYGPAVASAGVPFVCVPLASRSALARISPSAARLISTFGGGADSVYVFCRDEDGEGDFRARMFAANMGIDEDPATGSAAASLAAVLHAGEQPGEGFHAFDILQGVEMGRPSLVRLGLQVEGGALTAVTIGGGAVIVSEGVLHV
ncbi:PhzF family phenazine biosynthesis protein [Ancylobacter dichloromethanicus]|uniref:Phenazine biosynthesis protein PhzF n=1 Tax=Ancylobacter dichloromethanicus TaxID=518825 RepID=A0A9W6J7W4_9HYPH|nr:PhzF family phenazine biosynthesis protein [Ancylobacter dichloromethanicus]MBS7553902.1 PhzF family phenazine biosynthesis protein [Ancylobacter dichloromethanicus]GLK71009.1 phenazine biosynthesis protein PhzF [Ancylobacter dichloromethanicus]